MAMKKEHKDIIRWNIVVLANNMSFQTVQMHLIGAELFNQSENEGFESKPSEFLRNRELLFTVQTKGPKAFAALVKALKEDQDYLAELLENPAQPRPVQTGRVGPMTTEDKKTINKNTVALTNMDFHQVSLSLYSKGIFEIDNIQKCEAKATQSERNQQLLRIVQTRGPNAFSALVESLREIKQDYLADLLSDETSTQTATPTPVQRTEDTAKPVQPTESTDSISSYKMDSDPRGLAVIISNRNFVMSDQDVQTDDPECRKLAAVFKWLGLHVIIKEDLAAEEMKAYLDAVREYKHILLDCFVLAVLTRVEGEEVYGVDMKSLKIQDIVNSFKEEDCKTLKDKPKLFFINQRQERQDGTDGSKIKPAVHGSKSSSKIVMEPVILPKDTLLVYSPSSDGNASFIDTLTQVFKMGAKEKDVCSMIDEMDGSGTSQTDASAELKARFAAIDRLTKKLFMKPADQYSPEEEMPEQQPVTSRSDACYKMESCPRGKAVIITTDVNPEAEVDIANLQSLFLELEFSVDVYCGHSGIEVQEILYELRFQDHSKYDCFILALLFEGAIYGNGKIQGDSRDFQKINDILEYFKGSKCPKLKGKPKLFFLQAYKKDLNTMAFEETDMGRDGPPKDEVDAAVFRMKRLGLDQVDKAKIPNMSDILVTYATIPGGAKWRNMERGSLFIHALTEVIRESHTVNDIYNMTTQMNDRISELLKGKGGISLINNMNQLTKKVRFSPRSSSELDSPPVHPKVYPIKSRSKGIAVIINNKEFLSMSERRGTDVDCETLQGLFEGLGFSVRTHKNLGARDMINKLNVYRKMDHSQYDCFILVILTHGEDDSFYGNVLGTDDQEVMVQDIFSLFSDKNCKTLQGKPKIFFMQACRGTMYDKGTPRPLDLVDLGKGRDENDSKKPTKIIDKLLVQELQWTDMLILYATTAGQVSWRNSENGAWFIQTWNKIIKENAKTTHIINMTNMVNEKMSTLRANLAEKFVVTSSSVNKLTKDFYFYPQQ